MKMTLDNLEHRIQLKQFEIDNYNACIRNYPPDRLDRYGKPYLQRLENDLQILNNQLDDREGRREVATKLGYARRGLNNV